MKALAIHGKEDIRLEEINTPQPEAGQVLMRVAYAGICGSDLHYYYDGANGDFVVREPLMPGHEVCGVVAEDPSGELEPGTPITLHPATFGTPTAGIEQEPHLWPGGAYLGSAATMPHTQGGMCEYLLVRQDQVRVLPSELPLRRAVLAEPLSIGLHALTMAGDVCGQRVLVSGSGPIGLLTAGAALARGAASVTCSDMSDAALERARALGATETINVRREAPPAEAFDVIFECSGAHAAISAAFVAARRRGRVVQVGMVPAGPGPVALSPLIGKEVSYVGVFRFRDEVDDAVSMLVAHPELETVLTDIYPADQAEAAFAQARDADASGKVAISVWWEE